MYQPNNNSTFKLATVALMVIRSAQLASAGTQGAYINSYGVGVAVDNVSYFGGSTTAFSSSTPIQNPAAGVPSSGYPLPKATPSSVFCDSQGFANYVWNISCYVTGGATADDPALDARVHVPPQPCARYDINSTSDVVTGNEKSGIITVNTSATLGAAVWLRGFEYKGDGVPPTLADLLSNSDLKWDILLVGPFNLGGNGSCPLTIPFTVDTTAQNLYFVADGTAKSTQPVITCPSDVTFGCADPLVYPAAQVSDTCENYVLSYDPPAASLTPSATPITVTATATDPDTQNIIAQCQFLANTSPRDLSITCPANVVFGCNDPLVYPTPTVTGCGVTVSYQPEATSLTTTATIVTATATDQSGQKASCQFTASRQSLQFQGFDQPLGPAGGVCGSTPVVVKQGSVIPVKFTTSCNGSPDFQGTPTLSIQSYNPKNCAAPHVVVGGGNFQVVANQWHFNWDTTGLAKGYYELVVTLQDSSIQTAVVQVK